MFTRKYIFETRTTRTKRFALSSIVLLLFILVAFILLCIYIPTFAERQNERTSQALYQRTPDVIAVFTGDIGRIDYTLKKAEQYPSAKVFITGVYAKNSLATLLKKQGKEISIDEYLIQESHHIEIDYQARNTVENGLATINYLSKLKDPKTVLIISSDYHIFRISRIMEALKDNDAKYEFYYESIESDYNKTHNLHKLIKEVYKFFKAATFLLFWDQEK